MVTLPTQLTYTDISTFLVGLLTSAKVPNIPPFYEGPYVPEMPNELVTITLTGGVGYQLEGIGDIPTFQVRVRSEQNNQETASVFANTLDRLIYQANSLNLPTKLSGGEWLLMIDRIGSAPTALGPPDDAYRFDYVCNYHCVIGFV